MFPWLSRAPGLPTPPRSIPEQQRPATEAAPDAGDWSLRAARMDDRERLMRLYERLSPQTIYYRLFLPAPHGPDWAARFAAMTLRDVAPRQRSAPAVSAALSAGGVVVALAPNRAEIIGAAQYAPSDEPAASLTTLEDAAEIALVVEDDWQGRGVGTQLLRALLRASRTDGYSAVTCNVLVENYRAQRFVTARLIGASRHVQDGVYAFRARLDAQAIDGD